jgi:dTDP-4-dehydrorhamnose reductase
VFDQLQPWAVINTAGYVRVDDAETEVDRCMRENSDGPTTLAMESAARGIPLVTFSSDLVFDGRKGSSYVESDAVSPVNVYGRSKAESEIRVLTAHPNALVIRTSAFFGPRDPHNFVYHALRSLSCGDEFVAADDAVVSPTYVPDLVHASLDLLIDAECGLWHLANSGELTWAELARRVAEMAGVSTATLRPRSTHSLQLAAQRPRMSALASERGWIMPTLEDALTRFVADSECAWSTVSKESGEHAAA